MKRARKNNLTFISSVGLRQKIEHAIEMTSVLYLKRKEKDILPGIVAELMRLEVLYAASIIEAVLLTMFKQTNQVLQKLEYKDAHQLPPMFQKDPSYKLVIARQLLAAKHDRELMLDVLLKHFYEKNVISKKLKAQIDKVRLTRNTFHLSMSRKGIRCTPLSVNAAYDAVIDVLSVARKYLSPAE